MPQNNNQSNDEFDAALEELQRSSEAIHELLQQETIVAGESLKQYVFLEEQFRKAHERFKEAAQKKFGDNYEEYENF